MIVCVELCTIDQSYEMYLISNGSNGAELLVRVTGVMQLKVIH